MAYFTYRIQTGHVAKATIQANAAAVISAFTATSDQPRNVKWLCDIAPAISDGLRERALSGVVSNLGTSSFTLIVSAMTSGMFDYWSDTFFATTNASGLVTVQVPDNRYTSTDRTVVYQGRMIKPTADLLQWRTMAGYSVPLLVNVPFEIRQAVKL